MVRKVGTLAAAAALTLAGTAGAQSLEGAAEEVIVEQSCRALAGGTVGVFDEPTGHTVDSPDQYPVEPGAGVPSWWPEAPAELRLQPAYPLRTTTETFNRRYSFVTRAGDVYVRSREENASPWRELPLPACIAGRVAEVSVDDDEMIALDDARRVYTMDNALKGAVQFNWSSRWGTPFWGGPGYALPEVRTWSWSVISPAEDETWTDPAGNETRVGRSKVSHIWGLRRGGQRLTFWDPWLPLDESYETCGPHRGRFKAAGMSASGSFVFVVGRRGDLFTRLYDFDISGHNALFFRYAYEDQRGKGDGAPIQLPAAAWVEQPKIPGRITSAISIHKVGTAAIHRILRVEGTRRGTTGYWERDAAAPKTKRWRFHATGHRLIGRPLRNPRADTSRVALGPGETHRYRSGDDWIDYNVYCSPSRMRIDGRTRVLHHVDGLRQRPRNRGLDDVPREQYAALEEPGGEFTKDTLWATRDEVRLDGLDLVFTRGDD